MASSTTCPAPGSRSKDLTGQDEEDWWVKGFLEREKLPMPLPPSLALRREAARIDETVADLRDEAAVRAVVDGVNARIRDSHRRRLDGPLVVPLIDADAVVERWRREGREKRGRR